MFRKDKDKSEFHNLLIQNRQKEKIKKESVNVKWIVLIIITTFIMTFLLSFVLEVTIPNLSLIWGLILTLIFILIGILFDIIGVSVTSASEKVFHSMNARKVRGADIAVSFKKNADKVSSFCCDVVGDICGIISGAASTAIAALLVLKYNFNGIATTLIIASFVASFTIGGKAIGKSFAINKSDLILYSFSKIISYFYHNR